MLNSKPIPTTLPFTYSLGLLTLSPKLEEQAGNYTVVFSHSMTNDLATFASKTMTIVVLP